MCVTHPGIPYCICWAPNGRRLISGAESDGIKVWDAANGDLIESHLDGISVQALSISPDGQYLAVGGKDRIVRLIRLSDFSIATAFSGHNGFAESLAFTPDSDWLASGDDHDELRLWSVPKKETQEERSITAHRSWQGPEDWITKVAFHPKRNIFAMAGHEGRVHVWDGRDGRLIDTYEFDSMLTAAAETS